MSSSYKKTAKDLAFDRERNKLRGDVSRLKEELNKTKSLLDRELRKNEELNNTIITLESKLGIPKEEILKDIDRNKKLCSMLNIGSNTRY